MHNVQTLGKTHKLLLTGQHTAHNEDIYKLKVNISNILLGQHSSLVVHWLPCISYKWLEWKMLKQLVYKRGGTCYIFIRHTCMHFLIFNEVSSLFLSKQCVWITLSILVYTLILTATTKVICLNQIRKKRIYLYTNYPKITPLK